MQYDTVHQMTLEYILIDFRAFRISSIGTNNSDEFEVGNYVRISTDEDGQEYIGRIDQLYDTGMSMEFPYM